MTARKSGRWTGADTSFIADHVGKMHPNAIADALGRNPQTVRKYIRTTYPDVKYIEPSRVSKDDLRRVAIRERLRLSAVWKRLTCEFEKEQVVFLQEQYVKLMASFPDGDVTTAQDTQILMACKYDVLMGRCLEEQRSILQQIAVLEKQKVELRKSGKVDKTGEISVSIRSLYEAKQQTSSELNDHQKKYQQLMKALKATRDQRVAKVQRQKKGILDIVRDLEQQDKADRDGRLMEMSKRATAAEMKRLGSPHTYTDGAIDLPVLTPETVAENERE